MAKTIGDEFLDFFDNRQKENTIDDAMSIGTITSLDPLIVNIDGLDLYENTNFTINPYLKSWTEEVNATTTIDGEHPHSHMLITIKHPSKLKLGTKVFCYGNEYEEISKSYQYYYVIGVIENGCKYI